MNKQMLKQMISNELDLLFKTDHWGTEDQITIENIILKQSGMECQVPGINRGVLPTDTRFDLTEKCDNSPLL